MKKTAITLVATVLLSQHALAASEALEKSDAVSNLQQTMAKHSQFTSQFVQTVTDINGQVLQQGKGELSLSIPDRFNWHAVEPDESLIVADGENIWVYNPFIEQVTLMSLQQAIQASPMALLVQESSDAWDNYEVEQLQACYQITPKEALLSGPNPSMLRQASVCFENDYLSSLRLADSQGNTTLFKLTNHQDNPAAELFRFTPPQGVEIDDQRP
ncbi:outer membrane lipoprotein chaperone LolA [Paraferrimonas haliotis]|uniref:Outer-membrane lipoprotein carrier protein n=1 Tax=Paraferrimonas haliotis TaxID=2013866 RepID=A0AA37TS34_9GAMM|nr:outer membrane lipoprotein chaperone LolA [Paraferrimonas haliotis]GLS84653.1 outer-membrane lipoprotein carrier protein [Paraferrimonas haliotis]